MTTEQILELKRLAEAATPPPWSSMPFRSSGTGTYCDISDVRFVAAARNALPALADEVLRLRGQLAAALEHIRELEDAWMRGAISEHDGKGGTRSNRNCDVRVALEAALAAGGGK